MSKTTKLPSITTVTKTTPRKCQGSGFIFSNFRLISSLLFNVVWCLLCSQDKKESQFGEKTEKFALLNLTGQCSMNPLTIACVASVSVWFRSKERPRNDVERVIFGFGRTKTEREPKIEMGEGKGKETLTLTLSSLPGTPSPLRLLLAPFFVWSLTLRFLVLCSKTARKSFLRRLTYYDFLSLLLTARLFPNLHDVKAT